jgi:hypothetical protein
MKWKTSEIRAAVCVFNNDKDHAIKELVELCLNI